MCVRSYCAAHLYATIARVMQPPAPFADDLDLTLAEAFKLLTRGVVDRRSAFRTIQVATVAADGAPEVRTVVLRAFEPAERRLRFHTDRRSGKFAQLGRDPRVMLHGYDPGAKIQLRMAGRATIHIDDAVADDAWARTAPMGRACYAITPGPGTVVAAPIAAPEDQPHARDQFAAVRVTIDTLDWLWLSAHGHRRAHFAWAGGELASRWLVP